ncbi:MAG: hypothetical protein MJ245_00390 [Clostridia bacterium]|nr:hypothetical protein [Clostridia bacterium]
MKKRILRELEELGRTRKQLREQLNINNKIKKFIFKCAMYDLINDGTIIELYGGYYGISKEVA